MANTPTSDADLVALARKRHRQVKTGLVVSGLSAGVIGGVIGSLVASERLTVVSGAWAGGAMVAVIAVAYLIMRRLRLPPDIERRIAKHRLNDVPGELSRMLWAMPVSMILFALVASAQAYEVLGEVTPAQRLRTVVTLAAILVLPVVQLLVLLGVGYKKWARPVVDDELLKAQREIAIRTGFFFALAGGTAAFFVGLFGPRVAVAALPVVIMGSVAAFSLHFAILDRRAGAE